MIIADRIKLGETDTNRSYLGKDIKYTKALPYLNYFNKKEPSLTEVLDESTGGYNRSVQPKRAYSLDGYDDYVDIPDISSNFTNSISISVWIKTNDTANYPMIFTGGEGVNNYGVELRFHSTTGFVSFLIDTGSNGVAIGDIAVNDNKWHHIVGVYNGADLKIYIDGILNSTNNRNGNINFGSNPKFSIGKRANTSSYFYKGEIFDLKVYNNSLSEDEINNLFTFGEVGNKPIISNLIINYKCDDNGKISYDSSGNNYHGLKENITSSIFHYEGLDVPYSYQNEVGYSTGLTEDDTFIDNVSLNNGTLSFKIKTTDDGAVFFGDSSTSAYLLVTRINNTSPNMQRSFGSPIFHVDGVLFSGSRGNLYSLISDGEFHNIEISNITYNKDLYFGGYPTSLWALNDTFITDIKINDKQYDFYIPKDESRLNKDVLGNDLRYIGRVPYNAKLINSNCGTFDGVDDYVIANSNLSIGDEFTVVVFLKGIYSSNYNRILETDHNNSFYLGNTDAGSTGIKFIVNSSVSPYGNCEITNLTDNTYYKVVADYDGSTARLFINDIYSASDTFTNPGSTNLPLYVGKNRANNSGFFSGEISFAAVYDKVLTEVERKNIFNNEIVSDSLKVSYVFSEGVGNIIHDVSGNNNHGKIINATTTAGNGFWANKQDEFHYNLTKGFDTIANFDGSNDYVDIGSIATDLSGATTIKISGKFRSTTTTQSFIYGHNTSSGENVILIGFLSGKFRIFITNTWMVATVNNYNDGEWHEFEAIVNKNSPSLLIVDSETITASSTKSFTVSSSDKIQIGMEYDNSSKSDFYSGQLCDLTIKNGDTIVGDYSLSDKEGISILDSSSYENHGTLVGYDEINLDSSSSDENNGTSAGVDVTNFWHYMPAKEDGNSIIRSSPSNPKLIGHNSAETEIDFDPNNGLEQIYKGAYFVNNSDTVTTPITLGVGQEFSLEAIFTPGGSSDGRIFSQYTLNTAGRCALSQIGGTSYRWSLNGMSDSVDSTTSPVVNESVHLIATYKPIEGLKLYVNGILEGSIAGSANIQQVPLLIGSENSGTANSLKGLISKVRVINKAVSNDEALRLYNNKIVENIIAEYRFQNNSLDYSGNNNHASFNGSYEELVFENISFGQNLFEPKIKKTKNKNKESDFIILKR